MKDRIGELAGKIYHFLESNGEASMSQIAKNIDGPKSKTNMAIGWLAREDKLEFFKKGNGTGIRLK
ncbi:MAG: winged helix-turn-helix domain-containing protein [Candidatus Aenigmatarchaeota archaeon]